MKKNLLLLASILIALSSFSRPCSDTTKVKKDTVGIPIQDLKKAINIIERGKVVEQELVLTQKALAVAEIRIVLKDSAINEQKVKDLLYKEIIDNYNKKMANSDVIVDGLQKSVVRETKRGNRNSVLKWIFGGLGLAAGIFISK